MGYKLSVRSAEKLAGLDEQLVAVVQNAIIITRHDFGVSCGMRTMEEQQDLFRRGLTQTMDSRHLTGDAVDLYPYHKGRAVYDWPAVFMVADAIIGSAIQLDVPIRWGGAWDAHDVRQSDLSAEMLNARYIEKKVTEGKRAFPDGPHFEIPR